MTDTKKKLFGLFSLKSKGPDPQPTLKPGNHDRQRKHRRDRPIRPRDPDHALRKAEDERGSRSPGAKEEDQQHATSPGSKHDAHTKALPPPLTDWPPQGISKDGELTSKQAIALITPGAPVFKGSRRGIPHASDEYYNLYASCEGNGDEGGDCGGVYTAPFEVDSLSIRQSRAATHPWDTLEQPSMAFCYGLRAGEITLNHWVSLSGNSNPLIELRDPGVRPREVEFSTILNRLIYLEGGFEEDYEDLMYRNLYGNLLKDPEKYTRPHKPIEKQIADLIVVLSGQGWIDFSLPQNQVVGKFFANASFTDQERYFHQLLLSMELLCRVYSKHFTEVEQKKLVAQLPPCIAWDLALARKWRECIKIEPFSADERPRVRYQLRNKKAQVKALRRFARVMKWPNLVQVDEVLKERDPHASLLEDRSSDAMSYFTGMILPGVTLPWLIMNSLIDCDAEAGVNALASLTHMHPFSGFQYRSTTYWSSSSIVGKVLAPTVPRQIAGWIGPCRPAPDLSRIQIARIRQRLPKTALSVADVLDMSERSDALGPPAPSYPVEEYTLPMPEIDPNYLIDTIRVEKLALKPVHTSNTNLNSSRPLIFDAAVQFAVAGESWPLRLSYDVSFISACPCSRGPHPLFFDYTYQTVKIDELLTIRNWGSPSHNQTSTTLSSPSSTPASKVSQTYTSKSNSSSHKSKAEEENALDKVLVVEAFGVPDNEVLARAWCAHWALSAVLADMEKTCLGCAVREAYAGCLRVVILVERVAEE